MTTATCQHSKSRKIDFGWRICEECERQFKPEPRQAPTDRPHLVNGYWLSESDYELLRGYRRERDRAINAAKDGYQAKLKALLELVKRD